MAVDNRPVLYFDFGAKETEETLRTRLLLEAEICLSTAGRPQRQFLEELRGYIIKNKGSDARIYPILRIIHKYMNVTPTDFRAMCKIIGTAKAMEFIDGIRPPTEVWDAIDKLKAADAPPAYIREFFEHVIDGLEMGVVDPSWYRRWANRYTYDYLSPRRSRERPLSTR